MNQNQRFNLDTWTLLNSHGYGTCTEKDSKFQNIFDSFLFCMLI